jgi:hypothetical protein
MRKPDRQQPKSRDEQTAVNRENQNQLRTQRKTLQEQHTQAQDKMGMKPMNEKQIFCSIKTKQYLITITEFTVLPLSFD